MKGGGGGASSFPSKNTQVRAEEALNYGAV